MTEETRKGIYISAWLAPIIVVIILALLAFSTKQITITQSHNDEINSLQKENVKIYKELDKKADASDIIWLKESMERQEKQLQKINDHLLKTE